MLCQSVSSIKIFYLYGILHVSIVFYNNWMGLIECNLARLKTR